MGLAAIYFDSLKEHTKICKISKFGVNRLNNEQDTTILNAGQLAIHFFVKF